MDWFGFGWVDDRWVRLCGPFSALSPCSRELGRIGRERGIPDKWLVLTGGGPPRFVPYDAKKLVEQTTLRFNETL